LRIDMGLSDAEKAACGAIAGHCAATRKESAVRFSDLLGDVPAFAFATKNQIDSIVAHSHGETPDASGQWHAAHQEMQHRLSAYLVELDHVAELLLTRGISLVALKNGGIARGIYPCPGCCPMGDLDVLVKKDDFREAHRIMLADGYHFEFRSPLEEAELEAAELGGGAEYWKFLSNGDKLWFELQWRPVAGRWLRPDQEPSAEELMQRSVPIPGTAVRLLSPEDNLLQVSLHTAKHTYVRAPGFRLHLDVERIVRSQSVDWDIFTERVERLQVKTPVYFSLLLPKEFFGTPIPDSVLNRLRPSRWKENLILAWLERSGFFNPDERKFGRLGYIVFNMLLYDDIKGLLRSVVPDHDWMMRHYSISHRALLPIYHAKRLTDLIFRRIKT